MVLKLALVMDYQNVHLTGADLFAPGLPAHESLIEPTRFAEELNKTRNSRVPEASMKTQVGIIRVFRGQPSVLADPEGYRRNLQQKDRWERSNPSVVKVTSRPLKYYAYDYVDGRKIPQKRTAREKGIDVLCALELVELARSGFYDVVVLASRDTDLIPAVELAHSFDSCKVETVQWVHPEKKYTFGKLVSNNDIWATFMGPNSFKNSLDLHQYS